MSDLKLNESTGDLEIDNGDLVIVNTSEAVRQNINQKLKFFLGEWFLDTASGVPYYQSILKKNPNPAVLDGVLKSAIIAVPGVDELLSFNLFYETTTRELVVEFSVRVSNEVLDFSTLLGRSTEA